jgi:HEAT repeat protein
MLMDKIIQFFNTFPLYFLIAAAVIVLGIIILVILRILKNKKFRQMIEAVAEDPDLKRAEVLTRFSPEYLFRKSSRIVEIARKKDVNIPELLELTDPWINRYKAKSSKTLQAWILEFAADKGLYSVFIRALDHQKTALKLDQYLNASKDFLKLRRIALSGRGEIFDGNKGLNLFESRLDEIREMTGDPEWAARYFAINILLYDEEERSIRAVWESFDDSHSLVRSIVVKDIPKDVKPFGTDDAGKDSLYDRLFNLLLKDPVFEVRKAAKERIVKDFSSSYSLDLKSLNNEQILHVIQLLDHNSPEDQDLALGVLAGDDLELRQNAARYLQDCSVLGRLFRESYINDTQQLERNYDLLKKALEVNVTGFLKEIRSNNNRGSLLLASRLLKTAGPQESIENLADRVFAQDVSQKEDVELTELYQNTLSCVQLRGSDRAIALMKQELLDIQGQPGLLKDVLKALPPRGSSQLLPVLEVFLKDPDFSLKDELRQVLLTMPESDVLGIVMDIIRQGRDVFSHKVRIQALKTLGEMKNASCLQIILENLPILPLEEAREFAVMLSSYSEDLFNERVKSILDSIDAQSRAAIIVSLPATGKKTFLKEIREALDDSNPDVRIASIWALVEYQETKELARCVNMLRDPVDRVRMEVARALGVSGSPGVLKDLEAMLNDKNEVDTVILGVIEGLGASGSAAAVGILVRKIANDDEYKKDCMRSLSRKKDKKSITAAIELFKDAGPQLREDMSTLFKLMGYEGEKMMVELLKEDIPSLHHYIAEVLESTGFVENHIRKLKNRNSSIRQESASFLAAIRTKSAFRGIVLAARDPNRDVRIEVTMALEILSTEEGTEILKDLEQDPDKKVRKYTYWALERVRTKSLD